MTPLPLTPAEIRAAMSAIGSAHVSVSRGALPFVVPTRLAVTSAADVVLLSDHPSVVGGASRRDIAAVQVDAELDGNTWSLLVTGPLTEGPAGPTIGHDDAMFTAECLSSPHDHGIDALLRSGLTSRPD